MRYAQRGGYTPAEQQRLEGAERFAHGDDSDQIALGPAGHGRLGTAVAAGLAGRPARRVLRRCRLPCGEGGVSAAHGWLAGFCDATLSRSSTGDGRREAAMLVAAGFAPAVTLCEQVACDPRRAVPNRPQIIQPLDVQIARAVTPVWATGSARGSTGAGRCPKLERSAEKFAEHGGGSRGYGFVRVEVRAYLQGRIG